MPPFNSLYNILLQLVHDSPYAHDHSLFFFPRKPNFHIKWRKDSCNFFFFFSFPCLAFTVQYIFSEQKCTIQGSIQLSLPWNHSLFSYENEYWLFWMVGEEKARNKTMQETFFLRYNFEFLALSFSYNSCKTVEGPFMFLTKWNKIYNFFLM